MDLRPIERTDWNAALAAFPARTVFHRLEWLELVEESTGASSTCPPATATAASCRCSRSSACARARSRRSDRRFRVGRPPTSDPLRRRPTTRWPRSTRRWLDLLAKASYTEVRVVDHDGSTPDLRPLGFEELLRFETYLLELGRSDDDMFSALTSKCRNVVRKGGKNGYVVREDEGADFVADFWAMSEEVFGRWGIAPGFDERFLHLMVKHLGPAGLIDVRSAWLDDDRAATIVILQDDLTAYYWAGGSFEAHRRGAPNNLLLWSCIEAANRSGRRRFDFVSSSGSAGKFKQSFGPDAVETATHWGRSRTKVEGWMKDGYEWFLRRRRRTAAEGEG
ncbi:MAG: GNAT family N-acetyltransferase [Acidimicrobiales bacterium]